MRNPGRFGLEIRAADGSDAEGVADLLRTAEIRVDVRTLAARLDAMRAGDGVVLLAASWGPPSGVIALSWSWSLAAERRTALVSALLVAPESRRIGVARLLLKAAAQNARAACCDRLLLPAPQESGELRAFCGVTGFSEAGDVFVRPLLRQR